VQTLQVVDTATSKVTQTLRYPSPAGLFVGLTWSPDGRRAYASGGGQNVVHSYRVRAGRLTEAGSLALPRTNPAGQPVDMFPAGLDLTEDGSRLVVADHLADAASVIDLRTGHTLTVPVGHAPYGVVVHGDHAYVTNQGGSTVSVVDVSHDVPTVSDTIAVGTHPNAAVLDASGRRLFVANGDSDDVSVVDTATSTVTRTLDVGPGAGARVGSNPLGLAVSPNQRSLFVSNSGNNAVAVVDLATGVVTGTIPTGWYPTGVVAKKGRLFVASAKGTGAGSNVRPGGGSVSVAAMMSGRLATLRLPLTQAALRSYTARVRRDNRLSAPLSPDGATPAIKHVIYVVQENHTYDQILGSAPKGNGRASLNLFGAESAPNQRTLQSRFVTLDNFYANAEVSAQGWNWVVAGNSNPYTEAMWPARYSHRGGVYDAETNEPAIAPNATGEDSYVWQRLEEAGITYRNYGFYVRPDNHAYDAALDAHTDADFRGFDLSCPDNPDTFTPRSSSCGTPRMSEWKREFDQYVANDDLPTVELVRLPNDHTAGTKPGMPTPRAYVADNDLALGRLVEAVSASKYWNETAILVTEDDAQSGPDHVDAHRTISQVISPYSQHGRVDSTFYSTASMLRTIEDLVGVAPLTQFDSFATPMSASFGATPNPAPYVAMRPTAAGDASNRASAPLAGASRRQPLQEEDGIDERTFNEAIWKSVKGAGSRMPEPRHSLLGTGPGADDD
jgi:YVTN family beta-propeller protein